MICFSRFYDSGSINQLPAILGCLLHGVLGLFRLSGYSEKPNIGYVRITDIYFVLCKKYKLPHIRNKQQQIRVFQVLRDVCPMFHCSIYQTFSGFPVSGRITGNRIRYPPGPGCNKITVTTLALLYCILP